MHPMPTCMRALACSLQVLEHMVGQSAQGISSEMGLLGLALARGVLPVAGARSHDHLARRIMPFVMVRACGSWGWSLGWG